MKLLRRSVLIEGWCPYCQTTVPIEDGGPVEEPHVIGPEQMVEPTRLDQARWYVMIHYVSRSPYEGWIRHEWTSEQSLKLTPVFSLHVTPI